MKKIQRLLYSFFGSCSFLQPWSKSQFYQQNHYDNMGTYTGAAIEVAGPAGTDLTGWSLVLSNGSTGNMYNTATLSGVFADAGNGFRYDVTTCPTNGIKNDSPDGIALVDASNTVIWFYLMQAPLPFRFMIINDST